MSNWKKLEIESKKVLLEGWWGSYTVPHSKLYPFQWSWDAGFVAIGYAHFDEDKAYKEILSLFSAQWENGFLPHIVFHKKSDTYFPDASFYRCEANSFYPQNIACSGLTQPPVHGFAVEEIYNIVKDKKKVLDFLKTIFPKIYKYHQYLYENRDPYNEGLVYITHNWEAGTDNSPVWDSVWKRIDKKAPRREFKRRDTTYVDVKERPKQREYDYYLYLIDKLVSYGYDDKIIAEKHDFLIQDPLFNSMLVKSNESLIRIAQLLNGKENEIRQLETWNKKSKESFNKKLFDEETGAYVYYDLKMDEPIKDITCGSVIPLFANIPNEKQAKRIADLLQNPIFMGKNEENYLCPSFNTQDKKYESFRYWRGPIWININWMLMYGLLNYGYKNLADKILKDTLQIVEEQGIYEYYEPNKEKSKTKRKGYGGYPFSSWTPALVIDLLYKYKL